MHNQPRIILMHNNPLRVISIRIILSWLCRLHVGAPANASRNSHLHDRMSVLAELLIRMRLRIFIAVTQKLVPSRHIIP